MTFSRALLIVSLVLFGTIGFAAWQKKAREAEAEAAQAAAVEVSLGSGVLSAGGASGSSAGASAGYATPNADWPHTADHLPSVDRVAELFNRGLPQLPIVETITYSSRTDWMKRRPAWLADYAAHYSTSRHFIARSLNGTADYLTQNVSNGDSFNVYRLDKNFSFHLVVDVSRCKMWFYYLDEDTSERVLIKTYDVGLGRRDASKPSGLLTPLGRYTLGDKIATYRAGVTGYYLGDNIEMITVFGTRWVPFEKAIGNNTAPAKGYGLHGTPWVRAENGDMSDSGIGIGGYESDGCIRMRTEDVEELFAIIVTKPTVIDVVTDFATAELPGHEADGAVADAVR